MQSLLCARHDSKSFMTLILIKPYGGGPLIIPDLNEPTEAWGKLNNLPEVTQLTRGVSTIRTQGISGAFACSYCCASFLLEASRMNGPHELGLCRALLAQFSVLKAYE